MRVKRSVAHRQHKRNILQHAKGFRWRRKNTLKLGKTAVTHALAHAYEHRRLKKRDFRSLWQIRINAGARQHDLSYSRFIPLLKAKHIALNRKVLAELAAEHPEIFSAIVKQAKE